jgi:hypothetical protein
LLWSCYNTNFILTNDKGEQSINLGGAILKDDVIHFTATKPFNGSFSIYEFNDSEYIEDFIPLP